MKLALFGGVYSNDRALEAVLADARALGCEDLRCLGDLGGFGPFPDRAIDRLRAAGVPSIRGNYDDSVGNDRDDCACGYTDPRDQRFAQVAFDYTAAHTSAENKRWLRGLPAQERLRIGNRRVLLCHGSPRRVNEFLWESTSPDAFLEWMCESYAADVIACSHTGLPWHRALPSGRHVINVGAVGRPANDGRPEGSYAVLELGDDAKVELRSVAYDHEALAAEMRGESLPEEFVETILSGWWTTCLENLPAKERARGKY